MSDNLVNVLLPFVELENRSGKSYTLNPILLKQAFYEKINKKFADAAKPVIVNVDEAGAIFKTGLAQIIVDNPPAPEAKPVTVNVDEAGAIFKTGLAQIIVDTPPPPAAKPVTVNVDEAGAIFKTGLAQIIVDNPPASAAPKKKPLSPMKTSIFSVSLEEIVNTVIKKIKEIGIEVGPKNINDSLVSGVVKQFEGTPESKCVQYVFPFSKESKKTQEGGGDTEKKEEYLRDHILNQRMYKNIAIILSSSDDKVPLIMETKTKNLQINNNLKWNDLKQTKEYNTITVFLDGFTKIPEVTQRIQ